MDKINNIKAVIFDMDGVLLDSESISDRTWKTAFEEFGIDIDMSILNECRGCNRDDIIHKLNDKFKGRLDAKDYLERTGTLFYEIEDKEGIPLMPHVVETLEYLSKKYILCVASSTGGEAVKRQLANAGIIKYFKTLTTGDMVTHSKPDPQIYTMACNSIGMKPEECIAVEDSYNGVRSGVAANIKTVMVVDRMPATDEMKNICTAVCSSLKELKNFL